MVAAGALLSSVGTDWGSGADDNVSGDVFASTELSGYGAASTFDCSADGCAP